MENKERTDLVNALDEVMNDKVKIKESFDILYLNQKQLNLSQLNFFISCQQQFKQNEYLSEARLKILQDIVEHMDEASQRVTYKTI